MDQEKPKQLYAVSLERHENRNWRKSAGFAHAANDALVVVGTHEMIKAVPHAGLAFARLEDSYVTVMVQGLEAGRNLLISPEGRWLCGIVPTCYQLYPFQLARSEAGEMLVCVDEASGLVDEQGTGEEFFTADKQSSQALTEIVDKLTETERDKAHNRNACAVLQQYDLCEPWPLTIQDPDGGHCQDIAGLYRINETALNGLPAEAMVELRNAGALAVAFAQLFSMQNIHRLGELRLRHNAHQQYLAQKEASAVSLNKSELISFDNLR